MSGDCAEWESDLLAGLADQPVDLPLCAGPCPQDEVPRTTGGSFCPTPQAWRASCSRSAAFAAGP